jgi:hypothetical protein
MWEYYNFFSKLYNTYEIEWMQFYTVKITSQFKTRKMNTTELLGNGHQRIGELKQKFLMLTDSDLLLLENKQDEILERLHKKAHKVYGNKYKSFASA